MLDKALDMDRALGTTYTTENTYRIWHLDSEERLKVRDTDGSCQKTGEVQVRFSGNTESHMGSVCHQTIRGFYFFSNRLRVYKNTVLRKTFVPKQEKVTGE